MTKLYIAYGSNLNISQMKHRCPDAKPTGISVLRDWQLVFKGSGNGAYLTIEPAEGESVPVGIWEISERDEQVLDFYEGYPRFYIKREMQLAGMSQPGIIYIMVPDAAYDLPSGRYLKVCAQGYKDFGLDIDALFNAWVLTNEKLTKICPMCGGRYMDAPALSRKDNKTEICPRCGQREALEVFFKNK